MFVLAQSLIRKSVKQHQKYTEGNMTYLTYGAISVKEQMSIKQPW